MRLKTYGLVFNVCFSLFLAKGFEFMVYGRIRIKVKFRVFGFLRFWGLWFKISGVISRV